jgi:hypothetical protein
MLSCLTGSVLTDLAVSSRLVACTLSPFEHPDDERASTAVKARHGQIVASFTYI